MTLTAKEIKDRIWRGKSTVERFFEKVNKQGPIPKHKPELGRCWLYTGCIDNGGYGRATIADEGWVSHRIAWVLEFGDVPKGLYILHKCDNRKCVNPFHLFLGTYRDNILDAMEKGRWVSVNGEDVGTSKLTAKQVKQIRLLYRDTEVTQKELGIRFNVTEENIKHIVDGRAWKLVGGPVGTKKDTYRNIRGSLHRDAKLTEQQVIEILNLKNSGIFGKDLAKRYGVHKSSIYGIWSGKYWKHVTR